MLPWSQVLLVGCGSINKTKQIKERRIIKDVIWHFVIAIDSVYLSLHDSNQNLNNNVCDTNRVKIHLNEELLTFIYRRQLNML